MLKFAIIAVAFLTLNVAFAQEEMPLPVNCKSEGRDMPVGGSYASSIKGMLLATPTDKGHAIIRGELKIELIKVVRAKREKVSLTTAVTGKLPVSSNPAFEVISKDKKIKVKIDPFMSHGSHVTFEGKTYLANCAE